VSAISALLVRLVVARLASFAHDAPIVLEGVCFCVLLNRLGRHVIAAVDPPGKILKLAALAAERTESRVRWPLATVHAQRSLGHQGNCMASGYVLRATAHGESFFGRTVVRRL